MPDLLAELAELPLLDNYTVQDQYHDFVRTLKGSDEGKRVLRRIMEMGGVFQDHPLSQPIDPYLMAVHRGERRLALKILAAVENEPKPLPEKAATRPRRSVREG